MLEIKQVPTEHNLASLKAARPVINKLFTDKPHTCKMQIATNSELRAKTISFNLDFIDCLFLLKVEQSSILTALG